QPICVVKHLKPVSQDPATLEEAKRLFKKEAETLSRLGVHPQIPRLLAYFDDKLCLVQEHIEGNDLRHEIGQGKQLSEAEVIKMLREVLPILGFVHAQNVIHRDIKPSNLIRRVSDNKIVLIDFGAVKEIGGLQTTPAGQTAFTIAIGTPGYMAMEQQGGKPCAGSDLFALGMMAIVALTGIPPAQIRQDDRPIREILHQETHVKKKLVDFLEKMVHLDWRKRYQSAQEASKALDELNKFSLPLPGNLGLRIATAVGIFIVGFLVAPAVRGIYLMSRANSLVHEQEYQAALADYDRVLEVYPESEKAWFLRAFPLSKLNRTEEQLFSCVRALELDPEFSDAWNCKGLAEKDLGLYEDALESFRETTRIQPDFFHARNNEGEVLLSLERPLEALDAFDKAILYNEAYLFAWNNRGNALYQLERYAESAVAYNEAIEIDSGYAYAWNGRGNANRALGQLIKAQEDYQTAIKLKPDFYEAMYYLSLTQAALGRLDAAIDTLDEAITIKPDYRAAIQKRQDLLKQI
ncbi:MAG: tetratricopeptide repeat protein, partial [Cyanobacteria bacterium P01_H01_bin.15]